MTVEEAVIRIFSYQLGIPRSTDILNKNVYELGADSLDFVELIMMVEDAMSCEIDDITAENLSNEPVSALVDYVSTIAKGVDESLIPSAQKSYMYEFTEPCDDCRENKKSSKLLEEFSYAIDKVKNGFRMTRNSWSNQYIFLVPGSTFSVNRAPLNQIFPVGTSITYHSHIDIKYPDGTVGVWFPTQEDLLATDWLLAD